MNNGLTTLCLANSNNGNVLERIPTFRFQGPDGSTNKVYHTPEWKIKALTLCHFNLLTHLSFG